MRKFISAVCMTALVGCQSVPIGTGEEYVGDMKITSISATPAFGPANSITIVERPGKEDIVYASNDTSTINRIIPGAISVAGGAYIAHKQKCTSGCGDTLVVSTSESVSDSKVDVDIDN